MTGEPRLEFSDFDVAIPSGTRRTLVVTPAEKIRVGRARLDEHGGVAEPSALDEVVLRRVASWPQPIDVVLLRSWGGDEDHSWGFDPTLDQTELDELGYRLVQDQLALFREMLRLHVFAIVATDLTAREFDAMVRASLRLGRELSACAREVHGDPHLATDRWILEHFSLWTTRPFDEFVLIGMPPLLRLIDRHRDKLVALSQSAR